jgi:hypothetical protein
MGHNTFDGTFHDTELGRPYADTLASESRYDMSSIPSASMVHLDMLQRRARADSRAQSSSPSGSSRLGTPLEDLFADHEPDTDVHASLFGRSESRGDMRTRSPSTLGSRLPSRWGALGPGSTFSGGSRKGAFSPVPTSEARAGSGLRSGSRDVPQLSVDLSSSFEWEGMEDPFADPNKHSVD